MEKVTIYPPGSHPMTLPLHDIHQAKAGLKQLKNTLKQISI